MDVALARGFALAVCIYLSTIHFLRNRILIAKIVSATYPMLTYLCLCLGILYGGGRGKDVSNVLGSLGDGKEQLCLEIERDLRKGNYNQGHAIHRVIR